MEGAGTTHYSVELNKVSFVGNLQIRPRNWLVFSYPHMNFTDQVFLRWSWII